MPEGGGEASSTIPFRKQAAPPPPMLKKKSGFIWRVEGKKQQLSAHTQIH